jgi:hypothetical protein
VPVSKPEITVDLDATTTSSLRVVSSLSRLKPNVSFNEALDCRHPLGIYNVSISRILKKVASSCDRLEAYLSVAPNVAALHAHEKEREELIDYIELTLYAAAEHVDDLELIGRCFFRDRKSHGSSAHVRKFNVTTKPIRDKISGYINSIKHQQSRIRLFSQDFQQKDGSICFHGFFIESFHNGAIAPSPIWHSTERIISITSFLWSILIYLFYMSEAMYEFLAALNVVEVGPDLASDAALLRRCVVALARLPLYSFDDEHPFDKVRFVINGSEKSRSELNSGIYGSIMRRWSKSPVAHIGIGQLGLEGDGMTRSFQMTGPNALNIKHWD